MASNTYSPLSTDPSCDPLAALASVASAQNTDMEDAKASHPADQSHQAPAIAPAAAASPDKPNSPVCNDDLSVTVAQQINGSSAAVTPPIDTQQVSPLPQQTSSPDSASALVSLINANPALAAQLMQVLLAGQGSAAIAALSTRASGTSTPTTAAGSPIVPQQQQQQQQQQQLQQQSSGALASAQKQIEHPSQSPTPQPSAAPSPVPLSQNHPVTAPPQQVNSNQVTQANAQSPSEPGSSSINSAPLPPQHSIQSEHQTAVASMAAPSVPYTSDAGTATPIEAAASRLATTSPENITNLLKQLNALRGGAKAPAPGTIATAPPTASSSPTPTVVQVPEHQAPAGTTTAPVQMADYPPTPNSALTTLLPESSAAEQQHIAQENVVPSSLPAQPGISAPLEIAPPASTVSSPGLNLAFRGRDKEPARSAAAPYPTASSSRASPAASESASSVPATAGATPHILRSQAKHVYVSDLPANIDEFELRRAFRRFGKIDDVRLPRDKNTGQVMGFAYIKFTFPEAVTRACEANGTFSLLGKVVHIALSREDAGEQAVKTLFLANVWDIPEDEILRVFGAYGAIEQCDILADRGMVYVHYKEIEDAKRAHRELQGLTLNDRYVRIEFAQCTASESRNKSNPSRMQTPSYLNQRMPQSRMAMRHIPAVPLMAPAPEMVMVDMSYDPRHGAAHYNASRMVPTPAPGYPAPYGAPAPQMYHPGYGAPSAYAAAPPPHAAYMYPPQPQYPVEYQMDMHSQHPAYAMAPQQYAPHTSAMHTGQYSAPQAIPPMPARGSSPAQQDDPMGALALAHQHHIPAYAQQPLEHPYSDPSVRPL